jgi:hypothetical protein
VETVIYLEEVGFILPQSSGICSGAPIVINGAGAQVLEVFRRSADGQLFLLFLSDGAPSDHTELCCMHDVPVWQPCITGRMTQKGKHVLQQCATSAVCRASVMRTVNEQCLKRIDHLGDLFGRDRVYVGTVAFGPPDQQYTVLQQMAERLPRGSFQKLGLSADKLRTAFSSLTSDLTTLRTVGGSAAGLTLRQLKTRSPNDASESVQVSGR